MEEKKEIMFYGYSDAKAIHIYNLLNLFIPTSITVIIAMLFTILSVVIKQYYIISHVKLHIKNIQFLIKQQQLNQFHFLIVQE